MDVFLLISSILSILIFLVSGGYLVNRLKNSLFNRRDSLFIPLAILYLALAIVFFLWAAGSYEFNEIDFHIAYGSAIIVQTITLAGSLYQHTKKRSIVYSLTILPLAALAGLVNPKALYLLIPLSFLITFFSYLAFNQIRAKKEWSPVSYSLVAFLSYGILTIWPESTHFFTMVSIAAFSIALIHLLKKHHAGPEILFFEKTKEPSPIAAFLRHFLFIIVLTNFMFVGTVGVHEIGHLLSLKASNCTERTLVYSVQELPHVRVNCEDISDQHWWILSGIALPLIGMVLLALSRGAFVKELALEVVGFNLILSYQDFILLGISKSIALFISIIGSASVILSIVLLAESRTQ